jgi:hypothetical protein
VFKTIHPQFRKEVGEGGGVISRIALQQSKIGTKKCSKIVNNVITSKGKK